MLKKMKPWSYLRCILFIYLCGMFFFAQYFFFMVLNVALAWLALELGRGLLKVRGQLAIFLLGILWLLFYPNLPYLFTDFFHLQLLPIYHADGHFLADSSAWLAFTTLVLPCLALPLIGFWQLTTVAERFFPRQQSHFLLAVSLLASLGIYVGRFLRLHTLHLFIQPFTTLWQIFGMWSGAKIIFILAFTLIQSVILYLITLAEKQSPPKI
ncbi:DUF1361 domain-containing protein [Enterococcus nangangensis]|uniref:DUF1361 domain-containing protein n=1 Tax=Enterococcus nangangensis TaxID=2559926 RepID=UPI0010F68DD3|nr:DUF1361 domain-containing protein [Enterococcus nangangensis]